ncbi:MAG TPA: tetratricopeptide repeat protein [Nitrosopumilus sp.]|nr:tetratricopeptide repeat protein [Nitrosopumilus sp.]
MVGLFKYPKRRPKKSVRDGEYDVAIEFGKSLESQYSDDPDFMLIMGSVFYILEESERALHYFEKSFQLNDSDVETLSLKTNVHLSLGQKDDAIDCCYRILKLHPKNSEAKELLEKLEKI